MDALKALNSALKSRGVKGRVVAVKDRLFLRGTFTAADGTRKDRRIALELPAHPGQLLEAETRALELGRIITSKGFVPADLPWAAPAPPPEVAAQADRLTVAEAVAELQNAFWRGKVRTSAAERTWSRLKAETDRMPQAATLTMDLMVATASATEAGSRTRLESCKVLKRLAKVVGIDGTDRLDALRTPYEPADRAIPSDAELVELLDQVADDPTWGWCVWALTTYGCRPAEVFSLRPAGDGTAQVITVKRKGKLPTWRTALALPVSKLHCDRRVPWDVTAPGQYESATAKLYTDRWAGWLRRQHPTLQLYDLRHAWAIRSISKLPSTSIAAKCMGHDIAVHHRTYHRWIDQADIAAVAAGLT